eukprot:g15511.t1
MANSGQRTQCAFPLAAAAVEERVGSRLPPRLAPPPPDFVRHAYCPRAGPLWSSVAAFLGWNEQRARELVEFGGVYYKPTSAPTTAKPKRVLDPERQVEIGEYLRIFPEPRRYPSFSGVDWEAKIVYESPSVILVNKPPGVPAHATVDNFGENMLTGLRDVRPDLELSLPHRLDIDTSGLVIVAKDQETLRSLNDLIKRPGLSLKAYPQTDGGSARARRARNKALRRVAAAESTRADIAGKDTDLAAPVLAAAAAAVAEASRAADAAEANKRAAPAGAITKRYRALVEVLPGRPPLKASPDPLTHFQRVSNRAPKEFRRDRPKPAGTGGAAGEELQQGESWVECRLKVSSVTDAFLPTRAGDTSILAGEGGEDAAADADANADASVVEGGGESGRRSMLQEVEVELLTGRTHQIRGQLAAEGCPIYGDLLYGPSQRILSELSAPHAAVASTSSSSSAAASTAEPIGPTGGSFGLRRDLPPPPPGSRQEESRLPSPSSAGVDDDDHDDNREGDGGGGSTAADFVGGSEKQCPSTAMRQRARHGFVESPKMALQACHISLEFDGRGGEREQHSFTLGRDTCWWVEEEPWVEAGLP